VKSSCDWKSGLSHGDFHPKDNEFCQQNETKHEFQFAATLMHQSKITAEEMMFWYFTMKCK